MLACPDDNAKSFSLHQQLARDESGFFDSAFRGKWKDTESKVIRLPEYDAEHFQLFYLWIYAHKIFSAKADDVQGSVDKEWDRLANAWALGAYLQATDFKDAVTDAIMDKVSQNRRSASQSMHEIIYPKSLANADIRRLIVDIAVSCWNKETLEARSNDPSWADFFRDLSIALVDQRHYGHSHLPKSPWDADKCWYHEHRTSNAVCYRSKYGLC